MRHEADMRARARKFEQEMAAMPIALIHELPTAEDFTLDFCVWLQANYEQLLALERESCGGIATGSVAAKRKAEETEGASE